MNQDITHTPPGGQKAKGLLPSKYIIICPIVELGLCMPSVSVVLGHKGLMPTTSMEVGGRRHETDQKDSAATVRTRPQGHSTHSSFDPKQMD